MSKRQVILLCAIIVGISCIYYPKTPIATTPNHPNLNKSNTQPPFQKSNSTTLNKTTFNQTNSLPEHYINKLNSTYTMAGSYIFPFIQGSTNNTSNQNWNSAPKIEFQPGLKIITYDNLDNFASGNTSSTFTCPPDTPFAESYTLVNSTNNMYSNLRGYRNACAINGGGKAFSDILYGDDQHVDPNNGKASSMSAFVPYTTSEGCNRPEYNFPITVVIPESSIVVTPIYANSTLESQIIGYTQTQQVQPNCQIICTALVNTYCSKQLSETIGYCGEFITNSYLKQSTYLARNTSETFCACSISKAGWGTYAFTNAVDIESLINYSNPLKSVTCSNYSTRD